MTWGERCKRQPGIMRSIRCAITSTRWSGTACPAWTHGSFTYFHAEDSPYIRAIGPRYLISSVARIYRPGCKVDHMLVLEGPQGKQKSEALRTLAVNDAWFTDRLSHVASKDAAQEMAGVLIIEIAEMDALTRATASAMKSFLTRRRDRYRPPYGKHPTTLPRQCVFAGTINPPDGRPLFAGPDRGAAALAGRLSRHDRPRGPGTGARPAVGRGGASLQGGRAVVARDAGARSAGDRRAGCALRRRSLGGRRSVNGWGTAPTSALRRCSSTCSGSLQEQHSQCRADPGREDLDAPAWDSKSIDRERRGERENRYWREPSPQKVSRLKL